MMRKEQEVPDTRVSSLRFMLDSILTTVVLRVKLLTVPLNDECSALLNESVSCEGSRGDFLSPPFLSPVTWATLEADKSAGILMRDFQTFRTMRDKFFCSYK